MAKKDREFVWGYESRERFKVRLATYQFEREASIGGAQSCLESVNHR